MSPVGLPVPEDRIRPALLPTMKRMVVVILLTTVHVSSAENLTLSENLTGDTFWEAFVFFTDADPTHGFVDFVGKDEAMSSGLAGVNNQGQIFMNADSTNVSASTGRRSVRIASSKAYNKGLFVADLEHMPTGCGTWPAFWMVGDKWPSGGELDIIEGVDEQDAVVTTLHTSDGCDQSGEDPELFTGTWQYGIDREASNCFINAEGQWSNQGCGIGGAVGTMGSQFNDAGGGIFAALWDPTGDQSISTWFFPAGAEPNDLKANAPEPSTWGLPYARFALTDDACPPSHFSNMKLVFDLTFCGDWDGATYPQNCADEIQANQWPTTCEDFVANYPEEFEGARWLVNSIRVFE